MPGTKAELRCFMLHTPSIPTTVRTLYIQSCRLPRRLLAPPGPPKRTASQHQRPECRASPIPHPSPRVSSTRAAGSGPAGHPNRAQPRPLSHERPRHIRWSLVVAPPGGFPFSILPNIYIIPPGVESTTAPQRPEPRTRGALGKCQLHDRTGDCQFHLPDLTRSVIKWRTRTKCFPQIPMYPPRLTKPRLAIVPAWFFLSNTAPDQ